MKSGSDIHVPYRMKCDNFGYVFTFHLAPPSGRHFLLFNTLSLSTYKANSYQPLLSFGCYTAFNRLFKKGLLLQEIG